MQKIVSAQLALGVILAVAGGHFALRSYLGPALDAEEVRAAQAEARAAAAEAELAWHHALEAQRVGVVALSQSQVLRTLGADVVAAERPKVLAAALESAKAGAGGTGTASLFDQEGRPVLEGAAPELGVLPGTQAALGGAVSVRVEVVGGVAQLFAAAPVGSPTSGALVLTTPIDDAFLKRLLAGSSSRVGLWHDSQLLGSTLSGGQKPTRPAPGQPILLGDEPAEAEQRRLSDDAGQGLSLVAYAPRGAAARAPIRDHLGLGLWVLGGALLLLVVLVPAFGGAPAPALERVPGLTPPPQVAGRSIEPLPATPPPAPLQLKFQPPPAAPLVREPAAIDFPQAPELDLGLSEAFAKKTLPSHPAPPAAATPVVSEPLPSWATTPLVPSPTPAPPLTPARPEASLFDAIASAAVSAPPPMAPPPPPASSPFGRDDGDLVPKEGLSPEILAAQRAATQRAAHLVPPTPPPPVFSAKFDENLPAPKGGPLPGASSPPPPRGVSAPSLAPRPAPPRAQSVPPYAPPSPSSPPPIALGGSVARTPSGPALNAAPAPIPLPGAKGNSAIPLPGRSVSEPGREAPRRGTTVPGETPPYNPSNLPMASALPAPAPARSSTLDLPKTDNNHEPMPFDEEHYRVVYNEFVASKARLGEAVDNITYEGFRTKLRSSEQALLDRHKCRAVRFQVLVKDKTVSLRPQLVR